MATELPSGSQTTARRQVGTDIGSTVKRAPHARSTRTVPSKSSTSSATAGPSLEGFSRSVYIAGRFPNAPEVLVRWVRDAPAMAPESAMPEFDMTDAQARDIAAYLYQLR